MKSNLMLAVFMLAWFSIVLGLALGAATGYQAESPDELVVKYDGENLIVANGTDEIDEGDFDNESELTGVEKTFLHSVAPPGGETELFDELGDNLDGAIASVDIGVIEDDIEAFVEEFALALVDTTLHICAAVAHLTAPFFYRIRPFIPANVVAGGLVVISGTPLGMWLRSIWRCDKGSGEQ